MSLLPDRIESADVLLRRWRVADAEHHARAIAESAEHLRPWSAWMAEEPRTLEQRRKLLAGWEQDWAAGGDALYAVLIEGGVGGSCGLHHRLGPHALEIGYWIRASLLRRGFATKAAGLLTEAAFAVAEIEAVEIHHDRANVASAGVPRSLGYRLVGERPREALAPADTGTDCIWRMERGDWRRRVERERRA